MTTIALDSLHKSYEGKQVVHGIDLEIEDGEFVVIVGPSGCGKSTLLRMIAGLEDITGGTISIDGEVINDIDAADRGCAMVFQNYALYPHMTVAQNIGYPLRIAGLPKPERDRRIAEAAAILDLGAYLDRRPAQLSGGQRQCASQRCSCSTSRSAISMPSCASRCGLKSAGCTSGWVPPPSSSRTIRSRR